MAQLSAVDGRQEPATSSNLRRLRALESHVGMRAAALNKKVHTGTVSSGSAGSGSSGAPGKRPNIVLIMTDQHRGDCLGIDPHCPSPLLTPNLDFIGRSGTHFRKGYSESPSCIPARRTLMSGTAPAANGCVGMGGGFTQAWEPSHTLAGELARGGYQTEMIGKLHLWPLRRRFGFDHMQLADNTREANNDYVQWLRTQRAEMTAVVDPGMMHGVSANGWVGRPHTLPEEQMHSFWVVNQAMEFLQKRDPACPFFLNLSFIDPHPPLTPPRHYYERYIAGDDLTFPVVGDWAADKTKLPTTLPDFDPASGFEKGLSPDAPDIALDEHQMRCARAAYFGMINFVDDQIGRLWQFMGAEKANTMFLVPSPTTAPPY